MEVEVDVDVETGVGVAVGVGACVARGLRVSAEGATTDVIVVDATERTTGLVITPLVGRLLTTSNGGKLSTAANLIRTAK